MSEPLPTPSATGVRIAGDRYQWLVAWGACVDSLRDAALGVDNPVVRIGVEVNGVGNLDDVVLYRSRPPNSFKQVKYTVDSRTPVSSSYLTEPNISNGPSILRKIADAWKELSKPGEPIEVVLVTNRFPDPNDPLLVCRDARTRLLLPKAAEGGPNSKKGRARESWATSAGLTEPELLRLLEVFTFDLGQDPEFLANSVKGTMFFTGLRGDDEALNAGIGWIQQQVIAGRRELQVDEIRAAIDELGLHQGNARAIISVATLAPDPMAVRAAYGIDWVDRFDGADSYAKRRPRPPATWSDLQAEIEQIRPHLDGATQIAVTGSMRLAVAFEVGTAFRMVTGIDVATLQRGALWRSDAPYASVTAPVVVEHHLGQGEELAIAVEVATPMTQDVLSFLVERVLPVDRLVVISPSGGARDNAVSSPELAVALTIGIRDAVRIAARGHSMIHLFLACPMGLALLLGHRWNRIGPTTVYEDLGPLGYESAFVVSA